MERFGSSTAILNASRSDLGGFEFLKEDTRQRLLSARNDFDPAVILEYCRRSSIDVLSIRNENYPASLRTIYDPPPILYVKGKILPQDAFSLAVIGTRRYTPYGSRQTHRLTTALARTGFTIISGLALGIDAAAHRATMEVGGRTLAVLGSGLSKIYPKEHEPLADQIVASGGAVLSEYPPLHASAKWTFPQRNRIVVGLSLGVLVVEAPLKSGAMISARLAGEEGRDIFAVPGSIESETSRGCHQLIRDGAYMVDSIDDIVNVLGPMRQPVVLPERPEPIRHPNETSLNDIERKVLQHVGTKPTAVDSIVADSELARHQVVAALATLEERRIVRRISSETFVRL